MSDLSAHRIFYCERCGLRIPPAEFAAGRARVLAENEAVCAACEQRENAPAQPVSPTPSAASIPAYTASAAKGTRRATAAHHAHASHASHAPHTSRGKAQALPWKPALAGALAVGTLLGLFAISRKKPETPQAVAAVAAPQPARSPDPKPASAPRVNEPRPEPRLTASPPNAGAPAPVLAPRPAEAPRVAVPVPAEEEYDPRKAVADSLLTQARDFEMKNPDDAFGYRDKLQFLIERYRGTAAAEEAAKLIAGIKLPAFDPERHPEPTPDAAWAQAKSVLGAVDPGKDRIQGNWSLNNGALRSDRSTWSKLALPYILPDEYDLRLTFSREDNTDCLLVVLSRRGKPFIFSIGSGNRNVSFEDVRESRKDVVPTKLVRDGLYPNHARQQIVVQVRKNCLRGYLNGKLLVGCQVDDEGLSLKPELQLPQSGQVGFMTWDSVYAFHTLEILPLQGDGRALR